MTTTTVIVGLTLAFLLFTPQGHAIIGLAFRALGWLLLIGICALVCFIKPEAGFFLLYFAAMAIFITVKMVLSLPPRRIIPPKPDERDWMQDFVAWTLRRPPQPMDGEVLPPQRHLIP